MMDKSINIGKCTRRCLLVVFVGSIIGLLVQNSLVQSVYKVYVVGALNTSTEGLKDRSPVSAIRQVELTGVLHKNHTSVGNAMATENITGLESSLLKIISGVENKSESSDLQVWEHTVHQLTGHSHELNDERDGHHIPEEMRLSWDEKNGKILAIFILSAIGSNVSSVPKYQADVKLNGWQARKYRSSLIKCCIKWISNTTISEFNNPYRVSQHKGLSILGSQISCAIGRPLSDVAGVALQFFHRECPSDNTQYIKPLIPAVQPKHSFAICLKVVYGNVKSQSLIDWIEYYKEMQVDKIFMFVYNISSSVREIIRHYTNIGFVESRPFAFPWKGGRSLGMKTPRTWEDEQVIIYDCFQRLHGYTYMAILDLDEYLLPRKHENIKQLMLHLTHEYPKAGGFSMKSYLFNKDWGESGLNEYSDIARYVYRTHVFSGIPARPKNILLPSRVIVDQFFHTHSFTPKEGFDSITVNETTVAINHYRACYRDLRRACAKFRQVLDKDILNVYKRFKNRTHWFREQSFDNYVENKSLW